MDMKMNELILREEKKLCKKYGVPDIDSVLAAQDRILKQKDKFKKNKVTIQIKEKNKLFSH